MKNLANYGYFSTSRMVPRPAFVLLKQIITRSILRNDHDSLYLNVSKVTIVGKLLKSSRARDQNIGRMHVAMLPRLLFLIWILTSVKLNSQFCHRFFTLQFKRQYNIVFISILILCLWSIYKFYFSEVISKFSE